MKTLINEIIAGLDNQLDYTLNNTDYTSGYDHIIAEQLEYNRNGKNDFSTMIQLFDHFDLQYDPAKLDQYWDRFLDCLDYGNYEVEVRSVGYLNCVKNACFLQIDVGEQEYHLHDNFNDLIFKKGIQEYINKHTDFYCTGGYAYIDLSCYCILYTAELDYLIDVIEYVEDQE